MSISPDFYILYFLKKQVSLAASVAAALWRITITPMTTVKTMLQTDGTLDKLWAKVAQNGPLVLFDGGAGAAVSTAVGFYPWSLTYEFADRNLPKASSSLGKLCRRAGAGLIASLVSDVTSNSIRVVTAYKQTSDVPLGYLEAVRMYTVYQSKRYSLLLRCPPLSLPANTF